MGASFAAQKRQTISARERTVNGSCLAKATCCLNQGVEILVGIFNDKN